MGEFYRSSMDYGSSEIDAGDRRQLVAQFCVVKKNRHDALLNLDCVFKFPPDLLRGSGVFAPEYEQLRSLVDVSFDLLEPRVSGFQFSVPEDGPFHVSQGGFEESDNRSDLTLVHSCVGDDKDRHRGRSCHR